MRKYLYSTFFVLVTVVFLSACIKEKNFSSLPIIKFKNFILYSKDSADIIISFTDGDGDIGLTQEDTSGVFGPSSFYNKNLYIRYLYKTFDGRFVPYEKAPGDTLDFAYRIPKLIPDNQQKRALSGEIRVNLNKVIAIHDTIQYDVYLIDKALHKSNVVNTGTIIRY
jgi:hypothetical protein